MPRLQWLCVFAWGRGRECLYSWFLTSAWRVPPSPLPQGVITAPVQVSSAASPVRGRHLSLGNGVLHLSFLIPLFLLGGSLTGLGLWFLGLSWVNHLRPGLHCFLSSLFSFFLFFFFFFGFSILVLFILKPQLVYMCLLGIHVSCCSGHRVCFTMIGGANTSLLRGPEFMSFLT